MLFANVIIIQSMKSFKIIFLFVWFSFFVLMTSCAKEQQDTKQNILLICVDDLRPELKSFGANYIIAPNIDQLAKEGISFQKHFVNAPSCGPSRYTLLTPIEPEAWAASYCKKAATKAGVAGNPPLGTPSART